MEPFCAFLVEITAWKFAQNKFLRRRRVQNTNLKCNLVPGSVRSRPKLGIIVITTTSTTTTILLLLMIIILLLLLLLLLLLQLDTYNNYIPIPHWTGA